jgi:hypothetical protein
MIATNQTFEGRRIFLDGCSFVNCTFIRCTMVYTGVMGMEMDNPKIIDCQWVVQGSARETLGFLRALYQSGRADLVEAAFAQIRGVAPEKGKPTFN